MANLAIGRQPPAQRTCCSYWNSLDSKTKKIALFAASVFCFIAATVVTGLILAGLSPWLFIASASFYLASSIAGFAILFVSDAPPRPLEAENPPLPGGPVPIQIPALPAQRRESPPRRDEFLRHVEVSARNARAARSQPSAPPLPPQAADYSEANLPLLRGEAAAADFFAVVQEHNYHRIFKYRLLTPEQFTAKYQEWANRHDVPMTTIISQYRIAHFCLGKLIKENASYSEYSIPALKNWTDKFLRETSPLSILELPSEEFQFLIAEGILTEADQTFLSEAKAEIDFYNEEIRKDALAIQHKAMLNAKLTVLRKPFAVLQPQAAPAPAERPA